MGDKVYFVSDKGTLVVAVPRAWLAELKVGYNKRNRNPALSYRGITVEFYTVGHGPVIDQMWRKISEEDFVEGRDEWESAAMTAVFGCSHEYINFEKVIKHLSSL